VKKIFLSGISWICFVMGYAFMLPAAAFISIHETIDAWIEEMNETGDY
jgi:hypothetical protein